MERFAVNIKANIFKICRLCGMDNPHKVGILEEVVSLLDGEDELPLYKKIFNCIGIQVSADDKMPKTICALCFDKINDFHEFREMCYSTNAQTRKLLGLQPQVERKWTPDILYNPIASEQLDSLQRRNRKRRIDEIPPDIKFNSKLIKIENQPTVFLQNAINRNQYDAIKNEMIEKKGFKKSGPPQMMCNICQVNFCSLELLQSHLLKMHVPIIARYHCVECSETISNSLEIKNHNLWHRLSKTPFKCGRCDKKVTSLQGLTRHMRECSKKIIRAVTILPNIECKNCSIEFQTKNLYYMHNCVTSKLRCPKCNCKMSNAITTLKHISTCSVNIKDETEDNFIIKNEPIDMPTTLPSSSALHASSTLDIKPSLVSNNPSMVVIPSDSQINNSKKNKKKDTEDAIRRCDELLKNTMKTLVSIKHEPVEDNVTNIQSTISEQTTTQSSLNTNSNNTIGQDFPTVRIKQEKIDESYKDINTNIEITIKQEPVEKLQPALKLKIKKEHGTLNASFIENENKKGNTSESDGSVNIAAANQKNKTKQVIGGKGNPSEIIEKPKKAAAVLPAPIKIKQEIIEKENSDVEDEFTTSNDDFHHGDYDSDNDNNPPTHQNETNMPIVSNIKSVGDKTSPDENSKDTESNLTPLPKISSVSSAGNVAENTVDEGKSINEDESKSNENDLNKGTKVKETNSLKYIPQILSVSGGVDLKVNNDNESSQQTTETSFVMPQITSIASGVEVPSPSVDFESTKTNDDNFNTNFNLVKIKKEKIDPGYNDHYIDENNQNNDEQQSPQISDINNTMEYDMNFVGAVRIKQEIEFTEEGFGDEMQSEYSEDDNNSDYENELNNHINNSHKEMQQIHSDGSDMTTITNNDYHNNINLTKIKEEKYEISSSDYSVNENRTDLDCNYSTDINIDSNFNTNEYLNNNLIDNTNKMPIISQVNSININDIYKMQTETLNQNNIEDSLNSNDDFNQKNTLNHNSNNHDIDNSSINSTSNQISGPSSSSSSNLSVESSTLTIPEFKNINEIAENHNNENLEKLLRNEISEQIQPTDENVIPNLVENIEERQQEIDGNNILDNSNNEAINTINNSNIIIDNNITTNTIQPND